MAVEPLSAKLTEPAPAARKNIMKPRKGAKMLYPVYQEKYGFWGQDSAVRIGFINQDAQAVVAPAYNEIQYYRDKDGVPKYVIARKNEVSDDWAYHYDILDMDGKAVAEFEATGYISVHDGMDCVIVGLEMGAGDGVNGLFDLNKMKMVIEPPKETRDESGNWKYQNIGIIDENTVMVTSDDGAYIYDRKTEKKTAADKVISTWSFYAFRKDPDVHAVPVQTDYDSDYGYMDRQGKWLVPPSYKDASDFKNGYAYVSRESRAYAQFIDKNFKPVGREYNHIHRTTGGYYIVATRDLTTVIQKEEEYYYNDEFTAMGLLDSSLKEVVPLTDGLSIEDTYIGAVIVRQSGGPTRVIDVKDDSFSGTLDEKYAEVNYLGQGICIADKKYFHNFATGKAVVFEREYLDVAVLPDDTIRARYFDYKDREFSEFYDYNGNPKTGTLYEKFNGFFEWHHGLGADPEIYNKIEDYYWVYRGQWQGYIDGEGNWLYKENRYYFLED